MRVHRLVLVCLVLSLAGFAQSTEKPDSGFSIDNIDKSADPCVDFYQYACGNWLKKAEIPADQSDWISFVELYERNLVTERGILEKAAVDSPDRSPIEQKIGDFYQACMDEKAADEKGLSPLKPELDRIASRENQRRSDRRHRARPARRAQSVVQFLLRP